MANIDIQDLFEMEPREEGNSFIKTTKQEMYSHRVFLDENIGEPKKYRNLINLLYMASDMDEVNLFINTTGGHMTSAMAIIEAIKGSSAMVRAVLTGECHSAGSFIALNCHEVIVTDSAHMLCHTASYGTGGNTNMVQRHVDFSSKYINGIIEKTYAGFLTPTEISDLHHGIEFWFDSTQIKKRLKSRHELLNTKSTKGIKKSNKPNQSVPSED